MIYDFGFCVICYLRMLCLLTLTHSISVAIRNLFSQVNRILQSFDNMEFIQNICQEDARPKRMRQRIFELRDN